MLDWFDYHGHICIAFEMLGLSVFDFLVSVAGRQLDAPDTPDTPDTSDTICDTWLQIGHRVCPVTPSLEQTGN